MFLLRSFNKFYLEYIVFNFQCKMQPLEMHGCIDLSYNVKRKFHFHQCAAVQHTLV